MDIRSIYIKLMVDDLKKEMNKNKYTDKELQVIKQVHDYLNNGIKMSYYIEKFINGDMNMIDAVNKINANPFIGEIK